MDFLTYNPFKGLSGVSGLRELCILTSKNISKTDEILENETTTIKPWIQSIMPSQFSLFKKTNKVHIGGKRRNCSRIRRKNIKKILIL